ncbi:MAG TPA: hypothetical protein VG435_08695 [Acidimicrobiales bacterium]|nr:hypothetical protein [Acidimicrobiales bacterium]
MTGVDPVLQRIADAVGMAHQGDAPAARRVLGETWDEVNCGDRDPLYRCAIAHAMADLQAEPEEELVWDLRALEAARLLTDERTSGAGMIGAAQLFPSLHLNLADVYRRLGLSEPARDHVRLGLETAGALAENGYGRMIRDGLSRVEARLDNPSSGQCRDRPAQAAIQMPGG